MCVRTKLLTVACLISLVAVGVQGQAPAAAAPGNDLVGMLTSQLHVSPQQAQGGAGAIFGLVKTKVSPEQFNKISSVVPGMDGLLGAAPAAGAAAQGSAQGEAAQNSAQGAAGAMQGATGALQGGAQQGGAQQGASTAAGSLGSMAPGGAGSLASLAGSFQSLGMSPSMVSKFAPVMQNYLGSKGGPGVASIFSGALK